MDSRADRSNLRSKHGHSTHYRRGDWEVTPVETYTPDVPMGEFDAIVICYCQYNPVNAPLQPMPERQISVDGFGGDREAFEGWRESQKEPTQV